MDIYLGININFASFVYSPQETLRIIREELGLYYVEMSSDIATGLPHFLLDREGFKEYHFQLGEYAKRMGLNILSTFNFYRDNYSLMHSSAKFREIAFKILEAILLQAECYHRAGHPIKYAGATLGTIYKEDYVKENLRKELLRYGMDSWKELMHQGARIGLSGLTVEHMSVLREPPATICQAKQMLGEFDRYHRAHPHSTVPVYLVYDTGHGIGRGKGLEHDRRFITWFKNLPTKIVEIHLKNTDRDFQSTWPFTSQYRKEGIIDEFEVIKAVKTYLKKPEVYLILEIGGKKGREITEKATLTNIIGSVKNIRKALKKAGYRQSRGHIWALS